MAKDKIFKEFEISVDVSSVVEDFDGDLQETAFERIQENLEEAAPDIVFDVVSEIKEEQEDED